VLPDEIAADYDYVEDLRRPSAEADLALIRHRQTGRDAVMKLYRASHKGLDAATLAALMERGEKSWRHVVRIHAFDPGGYGRPAWEIQEHCRFGTLTDWRRSNPTGDNVKRVTRVVRQLAGAVGYLHSLSIVHRDLKPDNVLVRSDGSGPGDKLDLVLTDFGLATYQEDQFAARTVAGSWGFMAPEAGWGEVGQPGDWWALGAMVYELATGKGLFSREDGTLPPDPQVRLATGRGAYSTAAIRSRRVRLLADGLLTYDPADRWGLDEVRRWLRGESPPVRGPVDDAVPLEQQTTSPEGLMSGNGPTNTGWGQAPTGVPAPPAGSGEGGAAATHPGDPEPGPLAFPIWGTLVSTPEELAALTRRRPDRVVDFMKGPPSDAFLAWLKATGQSRDALRTPTTDLREGRPSDALRTWLGRTSRGRAALNALAAESQAGAKLVRFQTALDPTAPPVFGAVPLTDANLNKAVRKALEGNADAASWLVKAQSEGALRAWAEAAVPSPATAEPGETGGTAAGGSPATAAAAAAGTLEALRVEVERGAARLLPPAHQEALWLDDSPVVALMFRAASAAAAAAAPAAAAPPHQASAAAGGGDGSHPAQMAWRETVGAARAASAAYAGREGWKRDLAAELRTVDAGARDPGATPAQAAAGTTSLLVIAALVFGPVTGQWLEQRARVLRERANAQAHRERHAERRRRLREWERLRQWRRVTLPLHCGVALAYLVALVLVCRLMGWVPVTWGQSIRWAWDEAGLTTIIALATSLATGFVVGRVHSRIGAQLAMAGAVWGGVPALASMRWWADYASAAPFADSPHGFGAWPLWVAGAGVAGGVVTLVLKRFPATGPHGNDSEAKGIFWVLVVLGPLIALHEHLNAWAQGAPGADAPVPQNPFEWSLIHADLPGGGWWSPAMVASLVVLAAWAVSFDFGDKRKFSAATRGFAVTGSCLLAAALVIAALGSPFRDGTLPGTVVVVLAFGPLWAFTYSFFDEKEDAR
jgi:hypothetical protein